ncbi:MAG: SLBB domain-containing protein [Verrucomicrobia bacterium]|nr:SLBB domain-containing protein [Verrucomicrobiota bacterium]
MFIQPTPSPLPGGEHRTNRSASRLRYTTFASSVHLLGLTVFLALPGSGFAQATSNANNLKNLQVAMSPDGTEAILSMDYHYNGSAGPIVQIIPALAKSGDEDASSQFLSPGTMVVPGQGRVTMKIKFRKAGRVDPSPLVTDRVAVRMLSSNGRIVLASASFSQKVAWGQPSSVSEPTENESQSVAPSHVDHKAEESSDAVHDAEAEKSPRKPGLLSKFKTTLSKWTRRKQNPEGVPDSESDSGPKEVRDAGLPEAEAQGKNQDREARREETPAASSAAAATGIREPEELPKGALTVVAPDRLASWQERCTLGPGDVLNISLFGEPETAKTEVFVGPDGHVGFLEALDVRAAGLTVDELRARLDQELAKYRRAPHTMISPVAFKSKKYYLQGKIAKPGMYTLDQPLTIVEAVARAGGLATGLSGGNVIDLADPSRSFLVRHGKRFAVNLERLFQQGDLSQNIALEPEDYVYFAPGDPKEIYVLGAVNFPGPIPHLQGMTTLGAIAGAGGFNERAWQRRLLVVRGSLNQPEAFVVNATASLSSKEPDFKVQAKDIVFVSERPWIRAEELLDAAATSFVQAAVVVWTGLKVTPINP